MRIKKPGALLVSPQKSMRLCHLRFHTIKSHLLDQNIPVCFINVTDSHTEAETFIMLRIDCKVNRNISYSSFAVADGDSTYGMTDFEKLRYFRMKRLCNRYTEQRLSMPFVSISYKLGLCSQCNESNLQYVLFCASSTHACLLTR